MGLLTVIALYDKDLKFFPSGKQFTIPTESQILGTKILPTAIVVPGTTQYEPTAPLLTIKTTEFGDLYLNMTIGQYLDAVAAIYASIGAPELTLTLTVPGDTPAGTTVTNPLLYNATINAIAIDGVWIDVRTATLANSGSNGVLTLPNALVNGDWIAILYYKN